MAETARCCAVEPSRRCCCCYVRVHHRALANQWAVSKIALMNSCIMQDTVIRLVLRRGFARQGLWPTNTIELLDQKRLQLVNTCVIVIVISTPVTDKRLLQAALLRVFSALHSASRHHTGWLAGASYKWLLRPPTGTEETAVGPTFTEAGATCQCSCPAFTRLRTMDLHTQAATRLYQAPANQHLTFTPKLLDQTPARAHCLLERVGLLPLAEPSMTRRNRDPHGGLTSKTRPSPLSHSCSPSKGSSHPVRAPA